MAHLMACGAVTNRYKTIDRGITVGSFISGDHFLYDFVDQHPRLTVRRSRYTNDPYAVSYTHLVHFCGGGEHPVVPGGGGNGPGVHEDHPGQLAIAGLGALPIGEVPGLSLIHI